VPNEIATLILRAVAKPSELQMLGERRVPAGRPRSWACLGALAFPPTFMIDFPARPTMRPKQYAKADEVGDDFVPPRPAPPKGEERVMGVPHGFEFESSFE